LEHILLYFVGNKSVHGTDSISNNFSFFAVLTCIREKNDLLNQRCYSTEVQAGKHATLGAEEVSGRKTGFQDFLNPIGKRLVIRKACYSKTRSGGNKCSQDVEILPSTSNTSVNQVDLEKGVLEVKHLTISNQGMICTGCEKPLPKALTSMPAVSNVKASLVLSRAEFDIRASSADINVAETIKSLKKTTGFTCSKMTLSGHELDLIVEDPTVFIGKKGLAFGILGNTLHDSRTVRVTYHPEALGARDLMSGPFFELAKLAPMVDLPLITPGRAHLRLMLFKTLNIPVLIMAWLERHDIQHISLTQEFFTMRIALPARETQPGQTRLEYDSLEKVLYAPRNPRKASHNRRRRRPEPNWTASQATMTKLTYMYGYPA
ncbi:putative p-type copper atpase protein, partial [Botrytis fragariae]